MTARRPIGSSPGTSPASASLTPVHFGRRRYEVVDSFALRGSRLSGISPHRAAGPCHQATAPRPLCPLVARNTEDARPRNTRPSPRTPGDRTPMAKVLSCAPILVIALLLGHGSVETTHQIYRRT